MKVKQLGLRVLSTAAIMSIVTSIAAPAFADIYYIGEGDINITVEADGTIKVNDKVDSDGNVIIRGGTAADYEDSAKESTEDKEETPEATTIGESEPVTQEAEEETPAEEEPEEETVAEEEQPEETEEAAEEPKAEEEASAEEKEPEEEASEDEAEEEQPSEEVSEKEDTPAPQITDDDTPLAAPVNETEPVVQSDDDTEVKETFTDKVIKVTNNFLDNLKITLENVKIKSKNDAAMSVSGSKNTTIELDGKNVLNSSSVYGHAGLEKSGDGMLTITDTDGTTDDDGSLTATGGSSGAGIGGKVNSNGEHITIEGNAKVIANGGEDGAGIGGGDSGTGKDITIQDNADVTATGKSYSAGIGGGYGGSADKITIQGSATVNASSSGGSGSGSGAGIGSGGTVSGSSTGGDATGIVIRDHANVTAEAEHSGSGIGVGGGNSNAKTDITIGTEGADSTAEDVHATARSKYNSAIGGGTADTKVTIQGNATIEEAKTEHSTSSNDPGKAAIGGSYQGTVTVTIKDNAYLKKVDHTSRDGRIETAIGGGSNAGDVFINILGNAHLGTLLGRIGGGNANTSISIKDHVVIDSIRVDSGAAIGNSAGNGYTSTVIIDGGPDGDVQIGAVGDNISGYHYGINGTDVNIGDNVKIRLKLGNASNSTYVNVNNAEADIGSSNKPEEGGLINAIGDKTEIWYTDTNNQLVKIVHGKDVCTYDKSAAPIETVKPTCTTDGYELYNCNYEAAHGVATNDVSCDRTVKKVLKATGHTWVNDGDLVPATCTEDAHYNQKCSDCNETRKWYVNDDNDGENNGGLGHDFDASITDNVRNVKDATCTDTGSETVKCSRCDVTTEKELPIDPDAHDYDGQPWIPDEEATCTTPGKEHQECKHNSEHHNERTTDVDKTNHGDHTTHIEDKKEPTCEQPGYTGDEVCDGCHEVVKKGEEIPATGHDTEIVGKKDPTETEPGYTGDEVCKKCGETVKQGEVIPALGLPDDDNKGNTTVTEAAAPELWVTAPDTIRQVFHVTQSGTTRTYTSPYNSGTLTGTMEILQYLQEQGVETIVFTTNQRTSRFAVADLLALVNEGDVFYLSHMDANEPTLLVVTNDHTDLLG